MQKQGVTGRNTIGPPCGLPWSLIRLEAAWCYRLACASEAACRSAVKCYRRRPTTTDAREQNNADPLHYV